MFLLNIYLQINYMSIVKVIFCEVIVCSIGLYTEAVTPRRSIKKVFLKKTPVSESLF